MCVCCSARDKNLFWTKTLCGFCVFILFFFTNRFALYFNAFSSFVAKNLYYGKVFDRNSWLVSKIKKIKSRANNLEPYAFTRIAFVFFFFNVINYIFRIVQKTACRYDVFRLSRTNCST